ncbi:hypothetical protein Pan97_15130 [Bremerella volcania]|uniref:Uncharacterized protein n=1 Tax=Bremerella volcania TaxID=2527984 RepID=A0A518C5M3_9BACT|nr:hypothetical protein [Bremerella volcania]QDU74504.1 hypothetical protein Pan97_15130 [Bremerella volcania]
MARNSDFTLESPPKFSLWALAWLLALCGVVFAVLRLVGPFAAYMTVLFLIIVLVHLGASYLSHRLGHQRKQRRAPQEPPPSQPPASRGRWKSPNLAERSGLSNWQIRLVSQATLTGAIVGAVGSTWVPPQQFNYAVMGVCLVSGAALTGMGCFVLSNLIEHAWRSLVSARQGEYSQAID